MMSSESSGEIRGSRGTNVRPVESSGGEVGRRSLDEDVWVQVSEGLLGVERVGRGRLVRDLVAEYDKMQSISLGPDPLSGS